MPHVLVNGKLVSLPSSNPTREVIAAAAGDAKPGSRAILQENQAGGLRYIKPGEQVPVDSNSRFRSVPDRNKASAYFGHRSKAQKNLILEQSAAASAEIFSGQQVEVDDDYNWVIFNGFRLPDAWAEANPTQKTVRMMMIFPTQYPVLPTNGFYLPSSLKAPQNASHFFAKGYGGAFGETEEEMRAMADSQWNWYCTHIKPGCWQPVKSQKSGDWRKGDNLLHLIHIAIDVLTFPLEA
ncbi:MAG: hypothetical protein LBT59_06620 [Clostridiales bacterium]|jgi:hypothetical protein|nr:hypothetical protein [Clostridiales bacterium]